MRYAYALTVILVAGCGGETSTGLIPPPPDMALVVSHLHACDGVTPPSFGFPYYGDGDPRAPAWAHCESLDPTNDFVGDVTQTAYESGLFVLVFHRTRPSPFDKTACVTAQYSGHIFEFGLDGTIGMSAATQPKPGQDGWLNGVWVQGSSELVPQAKLRCWGALN